jgi:hypothetical protein
VERPGAYATVENGVLKRELLYTSSSEVNYL